MNKLSTEKRAQILRCICEGNSLRATSRLTDVAINSVVKLLIDAGNSCSEFQDKTLRNLPCRRIQCDEIWSFVGAKERNVPTDKKGKGRGDTWTWNRGGEAAYHFMHDIAERLANRVQMTTDGFRPYLRAVEDAFGTEIDFAQLVKIYGPSYNNSPEARYSLAQCMGARKAKIMGKPDYAHVSTSIVERNNLNMRMGMRRFTG
jgi:IS1 family transposase